MTTAARIRRFACFAGVALVLVIVTGCTTPPPPGGGSTTTSTSGPSITTTTPSTTTTEPSTTTSAPSTTTTTEIPNPSAADGNSVTVAGPFGELEFNSTNAIIGLDETNHVGHYELRVGIQDLVGD